MKVGFRVHAEPEIPSRATVARLARASVIPRKADHRDAPPAPSRFRLTCFDLGDSVLVGLLVRLPLGELSIDAERELLVSLLEIQLRHRLVDERLGIAAGE